MTMSPRVPPQTEASLSIQQQELRDHFCQVVERHAGPGASEGPSQDLLPILQVEPEVGRLNVDLLAALGKSSVPADVRETLALVCAARFRSAYFTTAHIRIASKLGTFSDEVIQSMSRGDKPMLDRKNELAYDTTSHLLSCPGPLPQVLWQRCNDEFGREGTIGLMHL